ncbi:hypothetical protein CNMCM5793_009337 [Aspergillus hiratsukae]|uniref:Uncharacterized protein n=1 Tax=Aspergillus hiratsukae TaxID=1194566 RepID=A0A8H6UFG1_9EURO|nr:hypothetical protein CNMCM5793_009337 [Aspergillus hiratsukae]KAF7169197.1 hypothetical protein CNMCM6106_004146 [Aspergillus hiratsukae]
MPSLVKSAGMNPLTCLKCMVLDICIFIWRWQLRTTTGQEHDQVVQAWLGGISSWDPEATEPALAVYLWFASDPESYTPDTFLSNFRLKWHRCWDYYGWHWPAQRPPSHYFSEPYTLDPKIYSKLEKSEEKGRSQRDQSKYLLERCRIVLLPYLEAAVGRYEKARTVSGKYELRWGTYKVTDMHHPFAMETRRLIAKSANTITFTNAEGKRRDLLAVVVANEKKGDAYNPCLAYMGIIWKIDNKSNLLKTEVYSLDEDFGFFLEYLHDILAEAALQCEE